MFWKEIELDKSGIEFNFKFIEKESFDESLDFVVMGIQEEGEYPELALSLVKLDTEFDSAKAAGDYWQHYGNDIMTLNGNIFSQNDTVYLTTYCQKKCKFTL